MAPCANLMTLRATIHNLGIKKRDDCYKVKADI